MSKTDQISPPIPATLEEISQLNKKRAKKQKKKLEQIDYIAEIERDPEEEELY